MDDSAPTIRTVKIDAIDTMSLGEDLISFEKELRDELRVFYSRDELDGVIDGILAKDEERERLVKVLSSIQLETKSDTELFETMTHREELMRSRALSIVFNKVRAPGATKAQQQEWIEKLRQYPLSLVHALDTKDAKELHKVIILLISVMDEEFKIEFQKKGGLVNLCKALSLPALAHNPDILTHLMVVVVTMVTAEQNRSPFREAGGLIRLIPYLSHPDPKIKLMATEALLNLTLNQDMNQTVVTRAGVLDVVLNNAFDAVEQGAKYTNLFLFLNLSHCEAAKTIVPKGCLIRLLSLLDANKAYAATETNLEARENFKIQRAVLEILWEMSKTPENQKVLGENNLLHTMQESFFLPLKPNSGVKWKFEILLLVLRIIDNLLKNEQNRTNFLDAKGIVRIDQIVVNHAGYPEECLMEAASIMTNISTNTTGMYQQQYGKLGLQRLTGLLKQFPKRDFIHHLVANMITSVSTNPANRTMIVAQKADKILMDFVKESRVKQVLVKSCLGLTELVAEVRIVRSLVSEKVVPHLVSLLQLNQPELQLPVVKILRAVAEESETGLIEIVRNRGIVLLVALLSDKSEMSWEVKLAALGTLKKILMQPGQAGPQNIQFFWQAEGELPLLTECLLSPSESVHFMALEIIIYLIKKGPEHRAHLINAGLQANLQKCLTEMVTPRSQSEQLGKTILGMLRRAGDEDETLFAGPGGAGQVGKRSRALWLKVICGPVGKLFPLRDSLKFPEFVTAVRNEFKIREWDRLALRHGNDEVEVTDQRTLNYILYCLQQEIPVQVEIIPKTPTAARTNKLDMLLQRLTHRQLRILVKEAIDQQIDLAGEIRQYVILELKRTQNMPIDRVSGDPIGEGGPEDDEPEVVAKLGVIDPSQPPPKMTGGPAPMMGGPPPPNMPPPPTLSLKKGFMPGKKKQGGASGGTGIDFMSQLKQSVALGSGGLKRVNLSEEDKKALLGDNAPARPGGASVRFLGEEAETGKYLWERDPRAFVTALQKALTEDYGMMYIIFKVLRKTFSAFTPLYEMLFSSSIGKEKLARILLDIGFTLSYTSYVVSTGDDTENRQESEPKREYNSAIVPYNFPVAIAYRTIYLVMKANRGNRMGGPLTGDVKDLKEVRIQEKKKQEEDVVSWGRGGTQRPANVGRLWDDAEEDTGGQYTTGWSRQEKPTVGSLW